MRWMRRWIGNTIAVQSVCIKKIMWIMFLYYEQYNTVNISE